MPSLTESRTTLDPVWRRDPALVRLFTALGAPTRDVRVVGGSVRDAVVGRDRKDSEIDVGTPDPPERVIARLKDAGLRMIPTGLDHGTVTALVDGRTFEITTLRRDTACDGRHAAVEFTEDWHQDARRRDFTFNAMSMAPDGTLFDDHDGVADARAGRVRFVGDPADRIREDYLRILRLFRFAALYGREPIDDATLAACAAHKGGLGKLSGERLQAEMAKLLAAPDPITALAQMRDCGVLAEILPLRDDGRMLRRLIAAEGAASVPDRPWLRRCAALIAPAALEVLAGRLKFSNADHAHLAALLADSPRLNPRATAVEIDRALFTMGVAIVRERVLLEWAAQPALEEPIRRGEWRAFLERLAVWQHRPLPVGGDDILALDILPGPSVGKLIDEMTAWWIETGFTSSRDQALIELRRRVSAFQNR